MNLPNGHLLQNGKYRLTHVVGQGGFGITYKGVWFTEVKGSLGALKTEVPIAIKEYFFKDYCYREDDSYAVKVHSETGKNLFNKFREKLIKEARILSDVHHPNVVNVLEVFEENNTAYIAMEYISGLSLKEMMEREGVLSEAKVLKYVHQIGEALEFVHTNNILHLDIKPSNILIDRKDNARLIDFGVSKRYDTEQHETSTTMLTLSKGYASIEQYDNEGTLSFTPYPDVYSLGATMYYLLTERVPTESILRATRPLAKPSELNPAISPKTEEVIIKAMEIVPADRYHTIREMMEDLPLPPAEELDEKKGEVSHSYSDNANDTTLIYPKGNSVYPVEDENEQTLLNMPEETVVPSRRKKTRFYLTLSLIVIALVASAITFVFYNKGTGNEITNPGLVVDSHSSQSKDISTNEPSSVSQPENQTNPGEKETEEPLQTEGTVPPARTIEEQPTTTASANDNVQSPQVTPSNNDSNQTSNTEVNATYKKLIASAEEKERKEDFDGAVEDYKEAGYISFSDELLSKMKNAENKATEKRRSQYEERMPFGNLTIVRKKEPPHYFGAIDSDAREVIPCIYLSIEYAEKGRAFVREDDLFDIYNSDGKLISRSVANYN